MHITEIACPTERTYGAVIDLGVKGTTYHGRPIVFHIQAFEKNTFEGQREGIRLYRLLRGSAKGAEDNWERGGPDDGFGTGWACMKKPKPARLRWRRGVRALQRPTCRPTARWILDHTLTRRVQGGTSWTKISKDAAVGDRGKYVGNGAVFGRWDWNTKTDHRNIMVELPYCIVGDIQKPRHNGGLTEIVLPVSNEVWFTYTGCWALTRSIKPHAVLQVR
ncbi:hypothetical protein PG988_010144 [Apiospora saccharicola]